MSRRSMNPSELNETRIIFAGRLSTKSRKASRTSGALLYGERFQSGGMPETRLTRAGRS